MKQERLKLSNIHLKGYKSINSDGQSIDFQDITIFLGANAAGKSNLISFFSMLDYMMGKSLQVFVGENGSVDSFLHYGSKQTSEIEATIQFTNDIEKNIYKFILSHAVNDTLIFKEENLILEKDNQKPFKISSRSGLKERKSFFSDKETDFLKTIHFLLINCKVFQFHDTSKTAKVRNKIFIHDNSFLYHDGRNLAAFLYLLKLKERKYYDRIVRYIQQIMPRFGDFELIPSLLNENYIMLNWREKKSDYLFGPHQISDGSLRFMCLATLLLQPPKFLPSVIILDEPELGLHPSAISVLRGMTKIASRYCQIVMATQSTRLVDEFEAKNIVVVERDDKENCSIYKTLDEEKLQTWLENYSLSELWEKNVLGRQP
ncbi:MAG: AAA family ATPase [Chitinophagales bacterium]